MWTVDRLAAWLETGDRVASIVGALAGVLAVVLVLRAPRSRAAEAGRRLQLVGIGRAVKAMLLATARELLTRAWSSVRTLPVAAQHGRGHTPVGPSDTPNAAANTPPQPSVPKGGPAKQQYSIRSADLATHSSTMPSGAAVDSWADWAPTPSAHSDAPMPLRVGQIHEGDSLSEAALVSLLDRGHILLAGPNKAASDGIVATLLLRALGSRPPGAVRILGYDPESLSAGLVGFAPLASVGILRFFGPYGLRELLDDLVDHIFRIGTTILAGEHRSLQELAEAEGRRPEPWRVAVLLCDSEPSRHDRIQLERVLRSGAACGVHLIVRGIELPPMPTVQTVFAGEHTAQLGGYEPRSVALDPPPPAELVTATCKRVAARIAPGPAQFAALLPAKDEMWRSASTAGLTAPIGDGPNGPVYVTLGDFPPHALIAGPSGTGKTNLIFALIGSLAARYAPTELEFYLLDFKEGVSFSRFTAGQRDPSWLPHVRLVGVNVNTDREFGLALLRFLSSELRRRADAAKRHEVSKLADLRAQDPAGHWPRIMVVVDEFQLMLAGRDTLADEAATLLEDLARRGRSQGIHIVLASQDFRGIEALWRRESMVAQFTLRIALPKAQRILADTNSAAEDLPRYHAVVNADSGAPSANQVTRIPLASDWVTWSHLQQELWRMRPPGLPAIRLFDGNAVPRLNQATDYLALKPANNPPAGTTNEDSEALLGETIDIYARSARIRLQRSPGRNLAVLGTRSEEACAILYAAGRSLARQHPSGTARFSVACLHPDSDVVNAARDLHAALPDETGWYDERTLPALLSDTATGLGEYVGIPHYLLLYAVDAAPAALATAVSPTTGTRLVPGKRGQTSMDQLRYILRQGPQQHTHVLAWWRTVAVLREHLDNFSSPRDQIGAWVALDIHGAELASLYPRPGGSAWYPRPRRGLFFDHSVHVNAEVIVPYR